MLTIIEMPNGNLSIKADSPEDVQDMIASGRSYWQIMADLFEPTMCNGSYFHFNAADGSPYVGLTDAPCIGECMDVADDGTVSIDGNLYYFDAYVTVMETEEFAAGREVVYTLHK